MRTVWIRYTEILQDTTKNGIWVFPDGADPGTAGETYPFYARTDSGPTMDIPLIYGEAGRGGICVGPAAYDGKNFSVTEPVPLQSVDFLKPRKTQGTVILADSESLSSGRFTPGFVERCKVPGNGVWLIESVYDEADILDAFLPGLEKLVIPIRTVMGDSVLESAIDMSGDCIPLIECRGGRAAGKERDPVKAVRNLRSMGFGTVMVADFDGTLKNDIWHIIGDSCRTIPYCPCTPYPDAEVRAVDGFPFSLREALK